MTTATEIAVQRYLYIKKGHTPRSCLQVNILPPLTKTLAEYACHSYLIITVPETEALTIMKCNNEIPS